MNCLHRQLVMRWSRAIVILFNLFPCVIPEEATAGTCSRFQDNVAPDLSQAKLHPTQFTHLPKTQDITFLRQTMGKVSNDYWGQFLKSLYSRKRDIDEILHCFIFQPVRIHSVSTSPEQTHTDFNTTVIQSNLESSVLYWDLLKRRIQVYKSLRECKAKKFVCVCGGGGVWQRLITYRWGRPSGV